MNRETTPVLAGLAAGIGLVLLFAFAPLPNQKVEFPSILTMSRLHQQEAIGIVVSELQNHFSNFTANDLFIFDSRNSSWISAEQAMQSERQIINLIFYHQNGTRFFINASDNTIITTSNVNYDQILNGRLVYAMEGQCGKGCGTFDVYYVDAITGEIIKPIFFGKRQSTTSPIV